MVEVSQPPLAEPNADDVLGEDDALECALGDSTESDEAIMEVEAAAVVDGTDVLEEEVEKVLVADPFEFTPSLINDDDDIDEDEAQQDSGDLAAIPAESAPPIAQQPALVRTSDPPRTINSTPPPSSERPQPIAVIQPSTGGTGGSPRQKRRRTGDPRPAAGHQNIAQFKGSHPRSKRRK